MPFQSEKQRRYLHANHPEIAKRWERDYAGGGRIGFDKGGEGYVALDAKQLWEKMMLEDYQPTEEEKRLIQIYLSMMNKGGRAGFNSGSNGITLGSDKYNIKFEPTASGSWTDQNLGHGYKIDEKNLAYGVDTTANIGPVELGIDFENLSNKYDVTKDGQTIEKDTRDDERLAFMLGITLEELHAKIRTNKDFKNFYLTITKQFHQGGIVPSHQAGIYGLAEGGQLVKPGPGRPGYGGPHETYGGGVEAGRDPDPPDYSGGDNINVPINNPHFDPPAVIEKQVETDELNRRIRHRNEWRNRNDKKKDWVNENLDTVDTGLKLKKFVGSGNPLDLLKVNPFLLGGSYLYNKVKDKDKAKTLGLTGSIDFGLGLGDDEKVLGDTDFSEIEGHTADISKADIKAYMDNETMFNNVDDDTVATIISNKTGNTTLTPKDVRVIRKYKDKTKPTGKFRIITAEGGIAGLKHGGRTGFFTGMREAEQKQSSQDNSPGHPSNQFSQTTTTTTTGDGPDPHGDWGTTEEHLNKIQQTELKNFVNQQETDWGKYDNPLDQYSYTPQGVINRENFKQKQALDNWNQVKDTANTWAKKKAGKKLVDQLLLGGATFGLSDVIGGIVQAFKTQQAKNEFINTIKGSIAEYQKLEFAEHSPHKDTLIQDLNQQLLDLTQTRDRPEEDTGGDGITYPAIARVNDTKEMELASAAWRRKQEEVDRSKQMAYWRMMMQPYMSAQGGRVPAGYNTGGLSNLFRLKNR